MRTHERQWANAYDFSLLFFSLRFFSFHSLYEMNLFICTRIWTSWCVYENGALSPRQLPIRNPISNTRLFLLPLITAFFSFLSLNNSLRNGTIELFSFFLIRLFCPILNLRETRKKLDSNKHFLSMCPQFFIIIELIVISFLASSTLFLRFHSFLFLLFSSFFSVFF